MEGKALALGTAFCFGINPIVLKLGFAREGRSDVAVVVGLVVTIPVFLAVAPLIGGFAFSAVTWPALMGFVLGGIFGSGMGRRWMYLAIDRIGASPATAIKNSAPVVTTFLAILLFAEHVTLVQWAAIVAIVGGLILVTWRSGGGTNTKQLWNVGLVAAFASVLAYGVRPLFLKYGLEQANVPMTAAFIGALAALAYATVLTRPRHLASGFRGESLGLFALAGVLQAFGFLALSFALSVEDVSVVYPVTATAPLFTLAFTHLMLRGKEELTLRLAAGVVVVTAGVVWL